MVASSASAPQSAVRTSCDGKELAGLAKRYPAVRKTTDNDLATKLEGQRRSAVKLVDLALKYPELAADVWARAEPLLEKHLEDKEEVADKFSEQYKKLWRLPATWKGSWVVQATQGKITDAMMARLVTDMKGSQQIVHEIFYFLTMTGPQDALPSLCASKKVCGRAFTMRYDNAKLQYRAEKLKAHIAGKGSVTWSEVGPYEVQFGTGGMAVAVKHDSGETAQMSADDTFTSAWTLFDSAIDSVAYVAAPKSKRAVPLATYFDEGKGPKKTLDSLDTLAKIAHKAIVGEIQTLQRSIVTDNSAAIASATKATKRSAAAARAKAMVAAKKKAKTESGHSFTT